MNNNYYQPYVGVQRPMYQIPTQMPYNEQFNQQIQTPISNYNQQSRQGLQGKIVDSMDVVKGMDIPYDGSISYFPSTDGKKIFTKHLQMDGNVSVLTYTLTQDKEEKVEIPNYATKEDIEGYFDTFKSELEEIKKVINKKGKKDDD